MRRHPASSTSDLGALLLASVVAVVPLVRGGVDLPAQLAAALLCGAALLLLIRNDPRLPWLGLPLLAVFLVGALQVIPLPGGQALSFDAPASGRELASAAAALLAFAAAWAVARSEPRREWVQLALGGAALAVAVAALGATLLGLQPLLAPTFPFVNPNHQAGLLDLGAFTILALALRRRGQARLLWMLAFVVVVSALFVGLSRGGIGAFFGGVALFVLLATRRQRRGLEGTAHPWRRRLTAGLVAALGVVAWLALEPVVRELATLRTARDDVKLELWRPALQLTWQHPWLGIARGSFATVFTALKTDPAQVTFTHLENEWLAPLVDLGVPAGVLLVGTVLFLWLRAAWRRDLSTVEVGLLAGTAAVAAQGLVDFSLEFSGVGVPFMVALGLLTRGERPARVRLGLAASGVAALLLATAAGAGFWYAHPTDREAAAVSAAPTAAEATVLAEKALRWHRADYVPAAAAGARWVREGRCGPAMPWLNRAMALNPTAPEPHFDAARCLAAAGQDQLARREFRLALLYGSPWALEEAADQYPAVEDLLQVVPDTGDGLLALGYLLRGRSRPEDAALVFRRMLEGTLDARALVPLAEALLAAHDEEQALEYARRRTREQPGDPDGWRVVAAALRAEGEDEGAHAALEHGLAFSPGSPRLLEALVQEALAAHHPAEARRLAETMVARTPSDRALREILVAAALTAQGRYAEAVDRARSAADALPDSPWPLMVLATYCQYAGRIDDAIAAVERAAALPGQRRELYEARLAELAAAREAQAQKRRTDALLKGR